MAVGYRTHSEPSIISRAAEMWTEGVEEIPYAQTFRPPFPFPGLPSLGNGNGSGSIGDGSADLTPREFSFTFVRGDEVTLDFFFPGVCWTQEDPGESPVAWEQHYWSSEMRDPDYHPADMCCYYYGWVPVWGGLPPNEYYKTWFQMTKVAEFACVATFVQDLDVEAGPDYGTHVALTLPSTEAVIYPGEYMWDLQSATSVTFDTDDNDEVLPETVVYEGVRTWRSGTATVVADYTIRPTKVVLP